LRVESVFRYYWVRFGAFTPEIFFTVHTIYFIALKRETRLSCMVVNATPWRKYDNDPVCPAGHREKERKMS
jgi:hypothetical protein